MRAPEFWYPARPGTPWQALLLSPLSALYAFGGALRAALAQPFDAGIPVICIGNLTAGGTGKTPVAIAVIARLKALGHRPFALTRGYGGTMSGPILLDPLRHDARAAGDEPLLLARHAPTIISARRPQGARLARERGASVIVMDDGFQNPTLKKTLSLAVIDAGVMFGNGFVIPAGPLREPAAIGLKRADAIILMGEGAAHLDARGKPCLRARLTPAPEAAALSGARVLAFAGIGRPEKFFATLKDLGAIITATAAFPDHHAYNAGELEQVLQQARALDALAVTTEKDAVRIPAALRGAFRVAQVSAQFDEPDALDRLLVHATGAQTPS
ncbi:MAG: tetraacyldisaccharide 4'-kinase [Alphaproteobacteria bacterium]|nr:tetraacyldisaccharide 4'-kinase [Alphaproteobacteria bacterium]